MENAHLKARAAAARSTGLLSIADDGGLVIDALDGAPGVNSHRFLGENTSFERQNGPHSGDAADVPEEKRTCRFVCAVVIATPDGPTFECRAPAKAASRTRSGATHGFGYDPIFLLPEREAHGGTAAGREASPQPSRQGARLRPRAPARPCPVGRFRRCQRKAPDSCQTSRKKLWMVDRNLLEKGEEALWRD